MNRNSLSCTFFSVAVLWLISSSSLPAQVLDAKAVQSLGLTGSFTLTYDMTQRNMMSPEVKASLLKQWRRPLVMDLEQHTITHEQFDSKMKQWVNNLNYPTRLYQASLIVQGNQYIYKLSGYGPSRVLVFDGKQTLEYTQAKNFQQRIFPGAAIGITRPTIVPGVGTPYAPLIQMPRKSGESKGVMSFTGDVMGPGGSTMAPGRVDIRLVKGMPQVLSLIEYIPGGKKIWSKWSFVDHQLFQGKWIASRMTYTTYEDLGPADQFDLKLVKATSKVENVDEFRLEHWLLKGDNVLYKGVNFALDPNRGSLDEQSKREQSLNVSPTSSPTSTDTNSDSGVPNNNSAMTWIEIGSKISNMNCKDIDGNSMNIASHKGKVVLVDFWATWCASCRAQTPLLVKTYKAHHDEGFEILSFSDDLLADPSIKSATQKVRSYCQEQGIEWPVAFDKDSKIALQLGLGGAIPTNFLVGRDGKVCAIHLSDDDIEDAVQTALELK